MRGERHGAMRGEREGKASVKDKERGCANEGLVRSLESQSISVSDWLTSMVVSRSEAGVFVSFVQHALFYLLFA